MANLNKNSIHRIRQELLASGSVKRNEIEIAYTAFKGADARVKEKNTSQQNAILARQQMFARKEK